MRANRPLLSTLTTLSALAASPTEAAALSPPETAATTATKEIRQTAPGTKAAETKRCRLSILPILVRKHLRYQVRHFHGIVMLQLERPHLGDVLRTAVDRFHQFHQVMNIFLRVSHNNGIARVVRRPRPQTLLSKS